MAHDSFTYSGENCEGEVDPGEGSSSSVDRLMEAHSTAQGADNIHGRDIELEHLYSKVRVFRLGDPLITQSVRMTLCVYVCLFAYLSGRAAETPLNSWSRLSSGSLFKVKRYQGFAITKTKFPRFPLLHT